MTDIRVYPVKNRHRSIAAVACRIAVCLILLYSPFRSRAGTDPDPEPPYDEILVLLNVLGVGGVQIPAAIRNETVYLSVTDVFDFLMIRNIPSSRMDSISGFFINPQNPFLIDKRHSQILYQGKTFILTPDDLIRTETSLYLRADYFGKVFGLDCKFNFRSLSVILTTKLELPVIREMRQQLMRSNIGRLRGEMKADTNIYRSYPMFRFGVADWSVVATQNMPGQNDTRLYLGLGSVFAGAETNVLINYDNNIPFREREQFYQWHYVNNDNTTIKQVTAGKYYPQSISSIYFPVVGLQFTNSPTTYRRAFGTYPLSGHTGPNWVVELYVNNELVNYVKADASGFFNVEVPLVYGNSAIKLRYYGPWGEERTSEQLVQIPFTFLPFRQLEYTASTGIEEDSLNSRYARGILNYGLTTHITVGGGLEYLSSVSTGNLMPFVNASARIGSSLLMAGEYTYGVRSKVIATYHLPSDILFEADYTRYKEGQKAINNTFLEERKLIVSIPFHDQKFSLFSRTTFYQIILPAATSYTTIEELISGVVLGASTNFTTYALINQPTQPLVYSNLSMAFRFQRTYVFTPQIQYQYNANKLMTLRTELGKYLGGRGYANVYYEKDYNIPSKTSTSTQMVGIGFRYDLSFARLGTTVIRSNQITNVVQSANGSLLCDTKLDYVGFDNRSNVGRGGILLMPFLDLNGNGKRDKDEPRVGNIKVQINSGRILYHQTDSCIRISELEAYANYLVRLTPQFENIAWHITNPTLSIAVDPNQFKLVEVPVSVMSEVAGTVYLLENGEQKPQGRVIVCFYRDDSTKVAQTITEADGTFDFTGLTTGSYTARISDAQLDKLQMKATPQQRSFTISRNKDGDQITGLTFVLQEITRSNPKDDPLKHIFDNVR